MKTYSANKDRYVKNDLSWMGHLVEEHESSYPYYNFFAVGLSHEPDYWLEHKNVTRTINKGKIDSSKNQKEENFQTAKEKFNRLLPNLLDEHQDKYVAIVEDTYEINENKTELINSVIDKYGYKSMYIEKIAEELEVIKLRSPKLLQ
ncbi:MAG TPA: hypothetical protein VKA68_16805 [bacterium]|nr:hypothetical protein [bacterium]